MGRVPGQNSSIPVQGDRELSPHAREFRIRAHAMDPLDHADGIGGLLASEDWVDRAEALDTLLRALAAGSLRAREAGDAGWIDRSLPCLADVHPNVRARAIEWLARVAPDRIDVGSLALERCQAPLEAERIAVARVLGICRATSDRGALEFLLADASERVREEALRSALGRGDASFGELATYFDARIAARDFEGAEALLESLDRSRLGPRMAEHLAERRPSLRELASPGAFGCVARIQGLLLRHDPTHLDPWDTIAADLVRALGGGPSRAAAIRRAATLGGLPLGLALVEQLGPMEEGATGSGGEDGGAPFVRGGRRDPNRREHFEACLATVDPVDPEGLEAILGHGDATGSLPFEDGVRTAFWEQIPVFGLHASLDRSMSEWRDERADVDHRRAVVAVACAALEAPGVSRVVAMHTGSFLSVALRDSDVGTASSAFRTLAHSKQASAWDRTLWVTLEFAKESDPSRFERFLRDLPEQLDAPLCLDGLEAMGSRDRSIRTRLAGLLSRRAEAGDTPATLEAWLEDEVARLLGDSPEERRSAVGPCMELLRARARMGGEDLAGILARFLERIGEEGTLEPELLGGGRTDPGKIAAAALGGLEGATDLRTELFGRETLRRRIRIELALAWMKAPMGVDEAPAREFLTAAYGTCGGELRGRILEALARDPDPSSGEFLLDQVLGEGRPGAMRSVALAAFLERRDRDAVARGIERVLREAPDVDLFVHAIEGLGRRGIAERTDALDRLWSAVEGDEDAIDPDWLEGLGGWAELSDVYDAREIVLFAWARGTRVDERAEALYPGPLEWAEDDLDRRWKGERVPGLEFRHRSELELTAGLAREQVLGRVLARQPKRWLRFDADLLLQMADRAARQGDQDSRRTLLRGALIAMHGETPEGGWRTREVATRMSLVVAADMAEDGEDLAQLVAAIELDYLVERVPDRLAEEQFGVFDARAGVDPGAWLATLRPLAQAWFHWTREEDETAWRLMEEARANVGFSTLGAETHGKIQDLMLAGVREAPGREDR